MKVLFLNNYDTSFIQNQINDLKDIGGIKPHFCIHFSYWYFYKYKKGDIKNVFSVSQQKSLKKDELTLLLHFGLPKNCFLSKEPFWAAKKIIKKFKKEKFDLIHAQNGFPSGFLAMLLSDYWKIPYMITSHGMDTYKCSPNSYELGQTKPFPAKVIECYKKALKKANCVAGVSHDFAKFMGKVTPEVDIIATPNSYNYNLFKPLENNKLRQELNVSDNDFIILSTGYFIERKGHSDIIKALSMIKGLNSNMRLVIIGGGPLEEDLIALAKKLGVEDKLKLISNIPQNLLVKWYNIADVFVFPSLNEPFGLGLVEAMACGLPAIATKTWGPNEIIEDTKNGFLVNKHCPQEIAEYLEFFYQEPEKRKEMGKYAAKSSFNRYSQQNYNLIKIYERVITNYAKQ